MKINSMTYQPVYEGFLHGTMAIHIELGNRITTTVQALLNKINAVFVNQNSSIPVVNILVKDLENTTDLELATFVNVLKDKKVIVIVTTFGDTCPSWYKLADHVIVLITNKPWLEFNANSIIYSPNDGEPLQEPSIGQNNINNNAVGFVGANARSKRDLLMFLKNARYGWRVLSRKEKITEISLEDL